MILNSFGLRRGSGGGGARRGGDGVSRDMTFRKKLTVSVLSERRAFRPWGLAGGLPAERGVSCSAFELFFFLSRFNFFRPVHSFWYTNGLDYEQDRFASVVEGVARLEGLCAIFWRQPACHSCGILFWQ